MLDGKKQTLSEPTDFFLISFLPPLLFPDRHVFVLLPISPLTLGSFVMYNLNPCTRLILHSLFVSEFISIGHKYFPPSFFFSPLSSFFLFSSLTVCQISASTLNGREKDELQVANAFQLPLASRSSCVFLGKKIERSTQMLHSLSGCEIESVEGKKLLIQTLIEDAASGLWMR